MADSHWEWHDQVFDLDTESPLAISHSLWEDLTQSEADVKDLFASTPASQTKAILPLELVCEKAEPCSSGEYMREDSPRLKRRRMLQFPGELGDLDTGNPAMELTAEPLESYSDPYIGAGCGDFEMQETAATSSMWYVGNDESLSSVVDAVEQSAESWMAGCFGDREVEASTQNALQGWVGRCFDERDVQAFHRQRNMETTNVIGITDFQAGAQDGSGRLGEGASRPAFLAPKPAMSGERMAKLA